MTKYLDELIHLYRKARQCVIVQFQDEEVENCLINGLPSKVFNEVQGYLDLSAEEIARKYNLLHIQWDALEWTSMVLAEKVVSMVQEKSVVNDETTMINDFEQLYTYKDRDCKNYLKMRLAPFVTRKVK